MIHRMIAAGLFPPPDYAHAAVIERAGAWRSWPEPFPWTWTATSWGR